jgi:hypothetical protein
METSPSQECPISPRSQVRKRTQKEAWVPSIREMSPSAFQWIMAQPRTSPPSHQTHPTTHSPAAPRFSSFRASETFYFRSVRCTSVATDQWRRCWQVILGNVMAASGRKGSKSLRDVIVRTKNVRDGSHLEVRQNS